MGTIPMPLAVMTKMMTKMRNMRNTALMRRMIDGEQPRIGLDDKVGERIPVSVFLSVFLSFDL